MLFLPLPLLLLIHVHLLGYPHADDPEYDEHVFNVKTRGLRDRTKTMEDLCYFLVGKIERKPHHLKSLFPTYPCLQPSDSVAFRAVLTKYLDGLRNPVVRPETHSQSQGASSKGKGSGPSISPEPWWWKDVVVRKSLLEECTGKRFERMIIALSTHALFANTSGSLKTIASDISTAFNLLPTLPKAHVSLEATIRGARRAWERSVTQLQQCQADSKPIESNTVATCDLESSKAVPAGRSIGELVSLCESKRDLLRREGWQGETGRLCLDFVVALAGFSWPVLRATHTGHINELILSPEKISTQDEDLLPPLPTAAAHHPQHMELFSSTVMSTSFVPGDRQLSQISDCGQSRKYTTRRINILITERLTAEQQINLALKEALNRMHTMREGLQAQLDSTPIADGASARVQSGIPSDVPIPPAPSKDVITETREKAARFPAQSQATRTGKAAHLAVFPPPKASRVRNQPSRPRIAATPTVGSTQSTRQVKLDNVKHRSRKITQPTEPPPTTLVPKSSGTESNEAVAQEASGHYQSSYEVRQITTTTQERMIINFDEDEAFLPSDLKPNIKRPATPKYDFIEDDSAFFPSFLKRDMVQMDPARRQARPACASQASGRESTPENGTTTPPMGDGKDEDDWSDEGRSMTLRDILVRAGDATFAHFDILHEDVVDVADETLGWE